MAKKKKSKKKVVKKPIQKVKAVPPAPPKKEHTSHPMVIFFFFIMTFIVIGLVFAQLFLQDKSFKVTLGRYNIDFSFPPNSILYISIFFIVVVILVLIRHAHKTKKLKREKLKAKPEKPQKPAKKIEEKKVSAKTAKKQKNPGTLYFGLFLLSLILFIGAIILNNLPAMILALALMALSLLGYQQLKKVRGLTKPSKKLKQEKQAKPKKAGFDFFKKQKESIANEAKKLPKIELGKYETYFDTLYRIIEKKGKVKLSVLATYFGIAKKRVEEWATILEEHEMLTIYYPLIGDPEIRKVETKEPGETKPKGA
jgi:quinol-cytochrome oxidoreductase complex cytochrome b subunit